MRFASLFAVASLVVVLGAHGCGGDKSCVKDADCGNGENCSYATGGGCDATGVCTTWDNLCEDPPQPSCACTGKTVFIGCGYPGTPVPVKHAGYCPTPTGTTCRSTSDCDPTALCAFPIAGGCGAKGVCVEPDRTCMSTTLRACGCDGNTVALNCTFGAGNAPAPVASMGACVNDGGAHDGGVDASLDSGVDASIDSGADASVESGADAADATTE